MSVVFFCWRQRSCARKSHCDPENKNDPRGLYQKYRLQGNGLENSYVKAIITSRSTSMVMVVGRHTEKLSHSTLLLFLLPYLTYLHTYNNVWAATRSNTIFLYLTKSPFKSFQIKQWRSDLDHRSSRWTSDWTELRPFGTTLTESSLAMGNAKA